MPSSTSYADITVNTRKRFTGYLAPVDFLPQLKQELKYITAVHDRLVIADGPPRQRHRAQERDTRLEGDR